MKELLREFQELKRSIANDTVTLEQAIVKLSGLLEKLESKSDSPVRLSEALMSDYSIKNLIEKNKSGQERIRKLNKIIMLQQLGFNFSEEELSLILSSHGE